MKTYDVFFNDDQNSNNKGWAATYEDCLNYIKKYNGTDESYFADYKGGVVSIYCNEDKVEVYSEDIPENVYYIYMHEGNRKGGYVFSELDVESGGDPDPDPELYGFATREDAEEKKKALEAYVEANGLLYTSFTIE